MVPEWSRRKTLYASSVALFGSLAGCSGLGFDSAPKIVSSLGTTTHQVVVNGQPTTDGGVPAVWGVIVAHPSSASKLIDWGALTPANGDDGPGTEFRTFDPDKQFMTAVVGVLPTGYGLKDYSDRNETIMEDVVEDFSEHPTFDDGQLRYDVTSYQTFTPEPDDPQYHYDYTFTLWRLNGQDRPDEILVNYHEP